MTTYGPPTAQEHLRQSVHGSLNYTNRAPLFCTEGVEIVDVVERRPIPAWRIVGAFGLAAALVVIAISVARAAERTAAYEIVAYPPGRDLRADQPNLVTIAGPFGREECRIAIASVKLANGSRLRCDRVEERRVR